MAAVSVPLSGSSQALITGYAGYAGFSIRETTGSAGAVIRIWDNPSAGSGTVLDEVSLAAGESARELYPEPVGASGIYVQVVSGAIAGSLRIS